MSNAKPNASKHGPASTPTSPWVIFAAVAVPLVGIVLLGAALVGVYFAFREPARPAQEFARLDEKKGTPNVIPPGSKTPEKKADQPQTKKDSRTKDVDDDDRFSPDPVLSRTRKDDKDVVEQPKVTPGHAESPPKTKAPIKIFVHHYRNHGLPDCKDPTRFVVRVQIDDEVRHFNGSVSFSSNRMAFVAEVPIGADGTVRWQK